MNMVYKNEVIIKCSLHDIKMYTRNLRVKQQYLSKPKSWNKTTYLIANPPIAVRLKISAYITNPSATPIFTSREKKIQNPPTQSKKEEAKKQFKKWVKRTFKLRTSQTPHNPHLTLTPSLQTPHHNHQSAIIKTKKWWSPQSCSPCCTSPTATVSHPVPPPAATPWSADRRRPPLPPASPAPRSSSATKRTSPSLASIYSVPIPLNINSLLNKRHPCLRGSEGACRISRLLRRRGLCPVWALKKAPRRIPWYGMMGNCNVNKKALIWGLFFIGWEGWRSGWKRWGSGGMKLWKMRKKMQEKKSVQLLKMTRSWLRY